ncbi:MAG: protein TolR [Gammaproteobacteria bacterium]|nr:protein TolR [Gammaproteobacteria bacterium]MBP9728861.1 protein TolR [Gammaproteobacteria bacterium]
MKYRNLYKKKEVICDINVVPYIDVMLVLLVIFMVTAPLLSQGVRVELPTAKTEALPEHQHPPLVVSVDATGRFYLDQSKTPLEADALAFALQAAVQKEPNRTVLIRGDRHIDYGRMMEAMVLLKQAGVSKIGLMTENVD